MFGQLGWGEILIVGLVGLIVLGPERLPQYAREAGKMLRNLRAMATNATNEIKAELGPELADLDVRDLHPKAMLRKYMEAEEPETTSPDNGAHAHLSWANPAPATSSEPALEGGATDGLPNQERYGDVT